MAKRSEKEILEEQVLDMRWTISDQRGRRLLRRIIANCGVFQSAMRAREGVMPEERMVFNSAQRDIGLWLMDEAQTAAPSEFEKMNLEASLQKALERGD